MTKTRQENHIFDYGNLPLRHVRSSDYNFMFQNQNNDFQKRSNFRQCELKRLVTRACVETDHSLIDFSTKFKLRMHWYMKKFSKVKVKNRCVLSTRSSTIKPFRVSRIYFRTLANLGQLPGVSKITNR